MKTDKPMNIVLAGILLLLISLLSLLPAFPILAVLQNYFPDLPQFYNIDQIAYYIVKAAFMLVLGMVSMCVYTDVTSPMTIKGYHFVLSRL